MAKVHYKEYHVYDNSMKMVGDVAVEDRGDGSRVVRLNMGQAQYLIDQGAIGLVPLAEMSEESKAMHEQFRGRSGE